MKKFVVIYMAPTSALAQMNNMTPEQAKAGMDEWMAWGKQHDDALVDMGAPLGKTKKVTTAGVADTNNEITGYSIVEGESLDSVSKLFTAHPHLKMGAGAWIEIIETVAMPAM